MVICFKISQTKWPFSQTRMAFFLCKDHKLQQTPFSATHFNRHRQHPSFVVNHQTLPPLFYSTNKSPIATLLQGFGLRLAWIFITGMSDQHMILKDRKVLYLRIHLIRFHLFHLAVLLMWCLLRILILHCRISSVLSFELS